MSTNVSFIEGQATEKDVINEDSSFMQSIPKEEQLIDFSINMDILQVLYELLSPQIPPEVFLMYLVSLEFISFYFYSFYFLHSTGNQIGILTNVYINYYFKSIIYKIQMEIMNDLFSISCLFSLWKVFYDVILEKHERNCVSADIRQYWRGGGERVVLTDDVVKAFLLLLKKVYFSMENKKPCYRTTRISDSVDIRRNADCGFDPDPVTIPQV